MSRGLVLAFVTGCASVPQEAPDAIYWNATVYTGVGRKAEAIAVRGDRIQTGRMDPGRPLGPGELGPVSLYERAGRRPSIT